MRLIEVTFRVYEQGRKGKELVETRTMNLEEVRKLKTPFEDRVSFYANRFWESIVLMGVFDEEKWK